jgi:hypothetical protein
MAMRRGAWLLASLAVLGAACSSTTTPTTTTAPSTTAPPATTLLTTTTTTTLACTSTSVPVASTTTVPSASAPVVATAGWSLAEGDLLVAGADGVRQVRDGEVIATPVLTPTAVAVADGLGGLVLVPMDPERGVDPWPAGSALWRVAADGSTALLYSAPGWIRLFDVLAVDAVSSAPSVVFTEPRPIVAEDCPAGYCHELDWLTVLPLDGSGHVFPVAAPVGSWEGGISGVAREDDRFVLAMGAEGLDWMGARAVSGESLPWAENPFPYDRVREEGDPIPGALTGIPGARRIAYLETTLEEDNPDPLDVPANLVVLDTLTGDELLRVQVAGPREHRSFLHADRDRVALTRITWSEETGYRYLPVRLVDLATSEVEDIPVEGLATIVRTTGLPPLPTTSLRESLDPLVQMGMADAVVVLSDVTIYPPMVLPEQPTVAWQAFTGTIEEVRFVKGDPSEYPALRVGEPMTAMTWAYRSEEDLLPQSDVEGFQHIWPEPDRLVFVGEFLDPDLFGNVPYPAQWSGWVAGALAGNALVFGSQWEEGEWPFGFSDVLTRVRHAARQLGLDTRTDLETLTAWVAELTAFQAAVEAAYADGGAEAAEALQADPSAAGPLTAAYVTIVAEGP